MHLKTFLGLSPHAWACLLVVRKAASWPSGSRASSRGCLTKVAEACFSPAAAQGEVVVSAPRRSRPGTRPLGNYYAVSRKRSLSLMKLTRVLRSCCCLEMLLLLVEPPDNGIGNTYRFRGSSRQIEVH